MSTATPGTSPETDEVAPETPASDTVLTAQDRCDHGNCSAAALTRATFTDGYSLDFCGHHTTKLRDALIEAGATLLEQELV